MKEAETEQASDDLDITDQVEDDDPDDRAGEEVAYDLSVPAAAGGA